MRCAWSAWMTLVITVVAAQLEAVEKDLLDSVKRRILSDLGMSRFPDMRTVNTSYSQMQKMMRKYLKKVSRTEKELTTYHPQDCEEDNSHLLFHPDPNHVTTLKGARLRFANSTSQDVTDQVFKQWTATNQVSHLSLHCHGRNCCRARLELALRKRTKRSTCSKACCRRSLKISFKEIGWDWIVQPDEFEAFYCKGRCRDVTDDFASTHALMQSILNIKGHKVARPCCAPRKLRPLDLLHYNDKTPPELVVTRQKGMIVKECACT